MSESIKAAREIELLPCPFCGEQVVYRGNQPHSYYKHYRECGRCLVRVLGYDTSQEADAAWNTRKVADEQTADLRNRLEAYKWRPVKSVSDLPQEKGEYYTVRKYKDGEFMYDTDYCDPQWWDDRTPAFDRPWASVIAWKPIEPFKELQEATK